MLAVAMLFSFVACGTPEPDDEPEECTTHVDNNGDGICDTEGCGAAVEPAPPVPVTPEAAMSYVEVIWNAVENAKSVVISYDITLTATTEAYEDGTYTAPATANTAAMGIELTLSKTQTGVNAKIVATSAVTADGETQRVSNTSYFIDNSMYTFDAEGNTWVELPFDAEIADMEAAINAILAEAMPGGFEISAEDILMIKGSMVELLTTVMTVNPDGSIGAYVNLADSANAIFEQLATLDGEITLLAIINSALQSANPELTLADILAEISTYGELTVGEIYAQVCAAFEAETGMTVEEAYAQLINDEDFCAMLIESGVATDTVTALQGATVAALVADYLPLTLNDLSNMLLQSVAPAENATYTLADLTAFIGNLASMKLGEIEGFDMFKASMAMIKANELSAAVNIAIGEGLTLKSFSITETYDMDIPATVEATANELELAPVQTAGNFKMQISVSIDAISSTAIEITLPRDANAI